MATTNETAAEAKEAPKSDFIEYLGDGGPTGTNFLTAHTVPRTDPAFKRANVKPTKDLVWERDPSGPGIGQNGARFLLSTEGIDPEVLDVLEKTSGFKRVSE